MHLNLNSNQIEDLKYLDELINLSVLSLNNNKIKSLEPIRNLELKSLDASFNLIENITFIKYLKRLNNLKLSNNLISQIPDSLFDNLNELNKIDLSTNNIKLIDSIGCKQNKRLSRIDISKNLLESINFLSYCVSVYEININNNQLSYIHSSIFSFVYLEHIDFSFNLIKNPINDINIGPELNKITTDIISIKSLSHNFTNYRLIEQNGNYQFFKAL